MPDTELVEDAVVVPENVEVEPGLAQAQPPEPDQVIVTVQRSPDGSVGVALSIAGDVRLTEVAELLRLAGHKWAADTT